LALLQELEASRHSQDLLNRTLEQVTSQQNDLEELVRTLEQQVYAGGGSTDSMVLNRDKSEVDSEREKG
jgi:hypothetical protein